ncbi:hypothetical protein AB0H83_25565 [Dactylosporangium sp. NPDC050688]|uniref:hypothetical protein n=1 Tax=Dactylosporangium sp. NPDC050688 TaxID=3157217 RepID=UPI0033D4B1B9
MAGTRRSTLPTGTSTVHTTPPRGRVPAALAPALAAFFAGGWLAGWCGDVM